MKQQGTWMGTWMMMMMMRMMMMMPTMNNNNKMMMMKMMKKKKMMMIKAEAEAVSVSLQHHDSPFTVPLFLLL
jgi:outer membrane phospholipase A